MREYTLKYGEKLLSMNDVIRIFLKVIVKDMKKIDKLKKELEEKELKILRKKWNTELNLQQ